MFIAIPVDRVEVARVNRAKESLHRALTETSGLINSQLCGYWAVQIVAADHTK